MKMVIKRSFTPGEKRDLNDFCEAIKEGVCIACERYDNPGSLEKSPEMHQEMTEAVQQFALLAWLRKQNEHRNMMEANKGDSSSSTCIQDDLENSN